MRADATVWVSWPKKAADAATDLTEDVVRNLALPLGLVDVKVCAIDEVWSGLKLVLIPPRPTFAQDMTPAERALMGQHVAYRQDLMHKQKALAFGPVADPQGGYGIGIIAASDDAEMETLRNNDPTIKANEGFRFEALPMPRLMSPLIT